MRKSPQGSNERRPATDKQLLDTVADSRRILADKVRRLRRSIDSNRYDSDVKLSIALDRMIANVIES